GRTVKALAQPTKQAVLYVFNRETGEPIWPIEEKPEPKGDTPREWYSHTPPSVSRAEGLIATLTMGAQAAATNWPGGSFDPELHTVFVASQTSVATAGLTPPPPGVAETKYFQGTVLSGARLTGGSGSGAGASGSGGADGRAVIAPAGRGAAPAGRGAAPGAAPAGGRGGGRGGGGA